MIPVQSISSQILSILDAEDSDRYLFDQDLKPAINTSVEWLVSVFNKAFSERKLTEENLSELVKVAVFQLNDFSRFSISPTDLGHEVWSILSVNPEIVFDTNEATVLPVVSPAQSLYRPGVSFISSDYSAKRLTKEEWEKNKRNSFMAGNITLSGDLKRFAYLNAMNYSNNGSYQTGGPEIEVRPTPSLRLVAVSYLKYPTPVNLITDSIELPKSLSNLVYQKAANIISFKQGDQTNLYSVTANDVNTLVKMMM